MSRLNAGSVHRKKPCKSAPPRVSVPNPVCRALATLPLQVSTCPPHSIIKIPLTKGVAKDILLSANEQEIWAVGSGTGHVSFGTRPILLPCGGSLGPIAFLSVQPLLCPVEDKNCPARWRS